MSKKANEEMLNALHHMTAMKIAELLKLAEGEPDLMLRVLREARGFLKDNDISADMEVNNSVKQVTAAVKVAELPFEVEEE